VRTAYHRNHLREITGPSEEELASGLPVNFIVGGFFPDVPTTKGAYHKGDAWGEGEKLHKSRYAGFRGDADPSNVSGLDDEEAYLPWLGTEWDVGGRGKGFNPNRYISRAAGAFTPRGGFRTGLSLDSYGTPVGAIASEFSGEDDEGDMVDFSMTGAGIGRGFNAPGLYKASRGSFGRKQGLRGSFLDGNPAQVGGYAADIGTYSDAVQSGAIASEFNDAYEDEEDAAMVDFSWTGAGPGRGFNRRGLYGVGRGGFVRREGFRGNFLDGNPVQVGDISGTGRDIKHAEHLKQVSALLTEIKATGKVPTSARLQAIASVFSIIPGGKPSPVDATWKWIAWLEKTKAKLESKVGAMQQTAEEIEDQEVRRQLKRKKAVLRSAQAFKKWAQNELIPTGDRFIDTDGNAFGYIVSLPSANDESDARAAATDIARRHNTSFIFVDRDDDWGLGEGDQVAIFSDDPSAVIVAPDEFSVSGYTSFSATSAGIFKKVKERLESAIGSDDVAKLTNKVKRLKKQLVGAEAQLAAAKEGGDAKSEEAESGRIAVGFLGKRKGQAAEGKVVLSAGKYDISKRTEDADEDDDEDAPAAPAYDRTLSDGDEGESVKVLQRALNAGPGFNLSIDGDFGPSTTAAVRTFQKSAQITADGVFGPDTLVALNRNLKGHGKPTVRFSGSDLVVGGLAGSGYPFDESGALDLDDLRQEAEEAQDAYDEAVQNFRARRGSSSDVREAGHRKAQASAAYEAAQEEEQEGGTVIRSSGFSANPVNQAQYAMMAAGLPGLAGAIPNGGSDIGRLMDAIGATKTRPKKKKKKKAPAKKKFGQPGYVKQQKAKRAAKKAMRQAGKPTRKKLGQKGFRKQTTDWAKRGFKTKPMGGKLGGKDMSSSSMSKTRPGSGSGVTKTRPKGLGASVPTTSRAQPGAGTPPGALPLSTDPGMIPLIPPMDPMMDPMMPPPGGEMGGGGGGPMGGGGGGGEPPGGGGGGGPMGGGGDEPEDDDYDFGDQEEIEDEQDPGFQIIDLGGDEEEEEPDAQFISLDGDEEGEEDTEPGVRVIPMPRPGFGRFGFMGPSVKAPGKHGRAIGVNPMGQTIYESGRIVIGSVGHSEDEDDGHYDDIYYDEDSYYDDDEDDSGLIGLSPGDLEADPQSYIDIDFGDGHSEEIETGNIDFADLVGAHPHPRLRRARARAQGRGRGPRAHPKHPPHPQTPPPRRRRPGWKKRQLGRGPR
jgi:hypothetical protein